MIAALKSAIQLGLLVPQAFDDLVFEDLWDEPRFIALQQELDTILADEHDKVLQLICFDNPVPDKEVRKEVRTPINFQVLLHGCPDFR